MVLISNNRVEWVEIDFAIMTVGAVTVPAFVTNNVNDNIFIINNCNPKLIIFENQKILSVKKFTRSIFQKKNYFD